MPQTLSVQRIHPLGWALVGIRLFLMLLSLVICAPLHILWRLVGAGRWWPRVFLSSIGAIAGLRVHVEGRPARGALLLANHVSWLDIPALANATGTAFVAHDGLAQFPFLKWLCEMNDTVFIARHDRASIAAQVEQVRQAMAARGSLTLFPEGTTSDGSGLLPFKSSLLSATEPLPAGASVQPVLLHYSESARIAWVGDEPGMDNFLRILARTRPIHLSLRFLPTLEGADLAGRKAISAAAQSALLRAFVT
ncbi:1-acyl-sn-glycerol-3-phosphate acyltransferase [Altererythrobacter aerius]|uniref:1-acyl-sn-glycerol-3-phosphate acyltransferase n=1 Tax=Tsuneonella aeria TaxID=1837929 RepID=A0A6I4TA81_9SPHN|nr:lysophospholipid acyltransferase family protein [Tsuneonella aeria]MXO73654.1 1-acyl-sn-glycerol-3-phosphate acyltransferase [Tsuneonella aeria]